jgi:DNA helicase-2/ATP-dependent DNA helicase PcrA
MDLSGLNAAQREAVLTTNGPVSVLAGAGSGKTRVLTHRVARLIKEGVPAHAILAITFTNKAAREMRERVRSLLEKEGLGDAIPFVSTFHALGVHILRTHGHAIGVKRHFTIYDRADSMRAIKQILEEFGVDTKTTEPRAVLGRISKEKGGGKSLSDFLERGEPGYFLRTVGSAWEKYDALLRREGALDFDDLIVKPLTLMREHESVRVALQRAWEYVHVDEFQDTNVTQAALVNLLVALHRNIFVVGDEDQCIYTWRQATIENLLSFSDAYPDAKTIALSENYRSTKAIVESANQVIEKNKNRHKKTATTGNAEGEPITLAIAGDEKGEASFIAETVSTYQDQGVPLYEMAVLYRTNFQSRVLEEAFIAKSIPYQVLGTKFFERREVKDVLSYLRLAVNRDSIADLSRIINVPARGIGKTTLLKLVEGTPLGSAQGKVDAFFSLMERIRTHLGTHCLSEVIKYIIEETGLLKLYSGKGEEEAERLENMKELATLAVKYDHHGGLEGALELIEEAALLGEQDSLQDEGGVKLMTVHAAKGLEFRVVFVTGLEEGLFPHEKEEGEDEEEERRLFYVAMTRAKEKLILSFAQTRRMYGTLYGTVPSSFIHDLDQGRVEVVEAGEGPSVYV